MTSVHDDKIRLRQALTQVRDQLDPKVRAAAAELSGDELDAAVADYESLSADYETAVALARNVYDLVSAIIDKHNEISAVFNAECRDLRYDPTEARAVCATSEGYAATEICRSLEHGDDPR